MPSHPAQSRPVRLFLNSACFSHPFLLSGIHNAIRGRARPLVRKFKNAGPGRNDSPGPCQSHHPVMRSGTATRFRTTLSLALIQQRPDRRSTTYKRRGGRYGTGPGTRSMYPKTGDQVNRCFSSLKEPEEPAHKRHGNVAELRDAAGDLLFVPEPSRSFLVVRVQKSRLIVIIFYNDMSCYIPCGRFEYFGSYFGNRGLLCPRIGITCGLDEWGSGGRFIDPNKIGSLLGRIGALAFVWGDIWYSQKCHSS